MLATRERELYRQQKQLFPPKTLKSVYLTDVGDLSITHD